jgi:hypothetical protein
MKKQPAGCASKFCIDAPPYAATTASAPMQKHGAHAQSVLKGGVAHAVRDDSPPDEAAEPMNIYALISLSIYKSANAGKTWTPMSVAPFLNGLECEVIVVDHITPATV